MITSDLKHVHEKMREHIYNYLIGKITREQLKNIYFQYECWMLENEIVDGEEEERKGKFDISLIK